MKYHAMLIAGAVLGLALLAAPAAYAQEGANRTSTARLSAEDDPANPLLVDVLADATTDLLLEVGALEGGFDLAGVDDGGRPGVVRSHGGIVLPGRLQGRG